MNMPQALLRLDGRIGVSEYGIRSVQTMLQTMKTRLHTFEKDPSGDGIKLPLLLLK